MKKTYAVFFLLFCIFSFSQTKKVLFVGNSITYFNDMPTLFESIANEKGKNVDAQTYAPGGTGFVHHHLDTNVYNLFKNNVWDIVVLQPGSGESAGATWPVLNTIQRGKQMMDSIKKYSPCAKIFLYQIPYGIPSESTYATYFQVQTVIKNNLIQMADGMQVPMVAAGECTRQHYASQPDLLLHSSYNDIHPNLNGSYLVACAMFCAIFQETVSGTLFNGGVSAANATYFQGIADAVILPNKPEWRINTYNLHAEFSSIVNENSVSFTNLSTNFDSLQWNFGDGNSSTQTNPQHAFESTGNKIVTLTATKNGCVDVYQKTIVINSLGETSLNNIENKFYYDSKNSELIIQNKVNENFEIYSVLGQQIRSFKKEALHITVNLNPLKKGVYIVKSNTISEKIIVH